jgi:hypothetical protein
VSTSGDISDQRVEAALGDELAGGIEQRGAAAAAAGAKDDRFDSFVLEAVLTLPASKPATMRSVTWL